MKLRVTLACVACIYSGMARADTAVQVHLETSEFEFGFLYGDFYKVDTPTVHRCTKVMSESDFLVALHLARVSGIKLALIMDWHKNGLSWYEITHRCDRNTSIYFVDLPTNPGQPYGRAWGHWRKDRRADIHLNDDEIRAFVQLQAMSEHSGKSPAEVLKLRLDGHSLAEIAGNKGNQKEKDPGASKVKSTKRDKSTKAEKPGASRGRSG